MKLSMKDKLIYGSSGFGKDMAYALSTIMMFYFTEYLKISPYFVGILFLVARLWDAVNDPMMGVIVDNTKSRFGKFRPWILIGSILNAVVVVFLFANTGLSGTTLLTYITITYVLWGMTYTLMDIPFWSMIPALSKDQHERESITVITRIFTNFGFAIISSLYLPLIKVLGNENESMGFFYLAIIVAVVFVVQMIFMVTNVKEKSSGETLKISFKDIVEVFRKNDQLFVVMITIVTFNFVMYITTGLGIYFFKYDIGSVDIFPIFALLAGVSQIISVFIYPLLSKFFKRKQMFVIAIMLPIIGYIGMALTTVIFGNNINIGDMEIMKFITSSTPMILLFVAGIIMFFGLGLSSILQTLMLADTVEYGEWRTNNRTEGLVFSTQTLVVKLASALSGGFIGIGLGVVGFVSDAEQTISTINGIRFMMFIIPIFGLLLALFIYIKYFKLDEVFYSKIVKELEERRT